MHSVVVVPPPPPGVKLPALQQLGVDRLLSAQRRLLPALAGRLALEGDALLHRRVAEGVGALAELQAGFRVSAAVAAVVVGESGRGARRGVTGRLLILLEKKRVTAKETSAQSGDLAGL